MLGHSLMTQFENIDFDQTTMPFVDDLVKAEYCVQRIRESSQRTGLRPIVFTTLVNAEVRDKLREADAYRIEFMESFLDPLERELGVRSTHKVGRSHRAFDNKGYANRIEAINFSLAHDDGQKNTDLEKSDVILVGVSRSGKTPTSLYLAMQHGLKAANYPLIPEDFERQQLPQALKPHLSKVFGLSISAERLSEIRHERRPHSQYADLSNCQREVAAAESMMKRHGIRWLSTTTKSIEEIATTIIQEIKPESLTY